MEVKEQIVDAVKQREKNYSIKIGEDWFGGYGICQVARGDVVSFEYKETEDSKAPNGKWLNIQGGIEKTGESMEKQADQKTKRDDMGTFVPANKFTSHRDGLIIRQVAFKGAVQIMEAMMSNKGVAFTYEGVVEAVGKYTNAFEKIILGLDDSGKE